MSKMTASTLPPIPHGSTNEKLIAGKLIADILARDMLVSVWEGEDYAIRRSSDAKTIFENMASTDTDQIFVYCKGGSIHVGWILLVWGNDCNLISDWTVNGTIDSLVEGANLLADELQER